MIRKEEIVAAFRSRDVGQQFEEAPMSKASVLIVVFERGGELHTLMTLRSTQLRTNAGEVCFPGGKRDADDEDDVATALREAYEEIGLPPHSVQVVCRLLPIISRSGLLVTPVIGFIDETFRPRANPSEVSAVFAIPLAVFTSRRQHFSAHTAASPFHSFHYTEAESGNTYHIFGLTATLAIMVATVALGKKPEFEVGVGSDDIFSLLRTNLQGKLSKL